MPNWCSNSITITGGSNTIRTLWGDTKSNRENENYGLLNAMVPMPAALKGTSSPPYPKDSPHYKPQPVVDGHNNWYDWCVERWGTKWDIDDDALEFEDHGDGTATIRGWFESAWSPPIAALNTFCEDMDGVYAELFYHEPGMTFVGCWDSEGGDDYYEYDGADSKTIRDIIPEYLDDAFDISGDMEMWEEEEREEARQDEKRGAYGAHEDATN
ncbi:MAG: hypothetical protein VX514_03650 [Candidatus Thermoplasmatota archaeon]|nr:hypothetical protein [Candidatus Thermoplasmatota archaeon]